MNLLLRWIFLRPLFILLSTEYSPCFVGTFILPVRFTTEVNGTSTAVINETGNYDRGSKCIFG